MYLTVSACDNVPGRVNPRLPHRTPVFRLRIPSLNLPTLLNHEVLHSPSSSYAPPPSSSVLKYPFSPHIPARQEAPFARDLSKAARDLTTFEEAMRRARARAKTPRERATCQSARRLIVLRFCAGVFAGERVALAAVSANSYAIVNNVAHISKLTATSHPDVAVDARPSLPPRQFVSYPPSHLHPLSHLRVPSPALVLLVSPLSLKES